MSNSTKRGLSIHPYIGGSATNLIKNVIKHGGVSAGQIPTVLATLAGTALTAPIRLFEHVVYNGKIEREPLAQDPVFIIGHWRSGTTHLHNVISQDPRFGYLSTLQAVFPSCSVTLSRSNLLKQQIAKLLPEKRMMDNVKMGLDYPQEEEFSLSCLTTASHHCNHFPDTIAESFDNYVLFNTSEQNKKRWKDNYLSVIKKASFMAGGKQLILKNPYNTARIKTLLEIFPNAKFIHIYRNPYNIYVSSLHDFVKEAEEMALQDFSEDEFAELCFELYEKLMKAYWESKDLVPKGNLAEVAYEDFDSQPLAEVERIYDELNLELDGPARQSITAYLDSIAGYKKNKYTYSSSLAEDITRRWTFAIERMKYSLPPDILLDNSRDWTCKMDY
ncbi:MAG: sulfotransferase [Wenzhouxiangellaceae bacterium]